MMGPARQPYEKYRSHFGSRYKLGCCGNASLFYFIFLAPPLAPSISECCCWLRHSTTTQNFCAVTQHGTAALSNILREDSQGPLFNFVGSYKETSQWQHCMCYLFVLDLCAAHLFA